MRALGLSKLLPKAPCTNPKEGLGDAASIAWASLTGKVGYCNARMVIPRSAAVALLAMSQQKSASARHGRCVIVLPWRKLVLAENRVGLNYIVIELYGSRRSPYADR